MAHRILLCRPLHEAGTALMRARPDVEVVALNGPDTTEFHQALSGADAVLLWLEPLDRAALTAAPRLRCAARLGVGYDTVDIAACSERRIPVMVVNGTNDLAVAEHAMMLMLCVAHRGAQGDRAVKAGEWWGTEGPGIVELAGRTVLVVGYGRIGARVARYCQAFHMRVTVLDPSFHPARIAADGFMPVRDLLAGLAEADVVTLHCPLTPATHHLMDTAAFAALKPGAILVNTARGPVVEEAALLAALRSGRLRGAGLDVLEAEPARRDNPLLTEPNVVLSPHNAGSTEESLARMACQAARNILDALDGTPDPAMMVNPEILRSR
jgi:D-3-phosphoglycerate dehydrogenase / 2-oxoglutarate reductase